MSKILKYEISRRHSYGEDNWVLRCWMSEGCKANDKWVIYEWEKEPTEEQVADMLFVVERSMDFMYKHTCLERNFIRSERV